MRGPIGHTRKRWTNVPALALLVLASTVFALTLVETGLRIAAFLADPGNLEDTVARPRVPVAQDVTLGDLIQPSSDRNIIYELKPNLPSVRFRGAPVSTNRWGFRGPDYARTPQNGTVRIVGIGDSVMFGWGVRSEETYLSVVESELNDRYPERVWEMINTAVPGYNTYLEVETLRAKGLGLVPAVVILGLVDNDLQLPSFIRSEESVFTLQRVYLWELLQRAGRERLRTAPAKRDRAGNWQFDDDPFHVPVQYRHMVGWSAFEHALDTLATLRVQRGFEVIAVTRKDSGHAGRMLAAASQRGFHTVSTQARLTAYMKDRGIEDFRTSELVLSPEDPHPSPLQHQLIAGAVLEVIEALLREPSSVLAVRPAQ